MKTDAQTEQEIKQRFEMSEKILNIRQNRIQIILRISFIIAFDWKYILG